MLVWVPGFSGPSTVLDVSITCISTFPPLKTWRELFKCFYPKLAEDGQRYQPIVVPAQIHTQNNPRSNQVQKEASYPTHPFLFALRLFYYISCHLDKVPTGLF